MNNCKLKHYLSIAFASFLIAGCGGGGSESTTQTSQFSRSFFMGFSPWPYDATISAVDDTYARIQNNGDIVAHHMDGGIPWQAAYSSTAYHVNVKNELAGKVTKTRPGKIVYLAINSLNLGRNNIAENWGASTGEALTPPWSARNFDSIEVITAYTNFSLDLIAQFNPTYFNYAIEVNDLMLNNPAGFDAFVDFASHVYPTIKAAHPNLIVMVSLAMKTPGSAEMVITHSGFSRIRDYVDLVGVSTYGYAFYNHADKGDPANLPSNWLSQITAIVGSKPVAIAETGWIAEDLSVPSFGLSESSDETKQDAYIKALFEQANSLNAQFVIWYSIVDYDALWNGLLGQDPLAKIWRDTGLYDESLRARSGLRRWQEWLSRPKR